MSHDGDRATRAIRIEGISKRYRLAARGQAAETLTGSLLGWVRAPINNLRALRRLTRFEAEGAGGDDDVIWALRDVSFQVEPGEVVGLIGRNGSGKSTLLKILTRITEPTAGRAWIQGRVASLLEVGTGFHQELSGRDNVYLNGAVLGMTKREIDSKFDEIVAFSGVERFLETPIKRYSSGMKVRLAFAVAAHLEAEILLIDEVLAVGDAAFQRKCIGKMDEVARSGRTIIFVSHSLGAVATLCSRAIYLKEGRVAASGETNAVISTYLRELEEVARADLLSVGGIRPGSGLARVSSFDIALLGADGSAGRTARVGTDFAFRIGVRLSPGVEVVRCPHVSIEVFSADNVFLTELGNYAAGQDLPDLTGDGLLCCTVSRWPLMPGTYRVSIRLTSELQLVDSLQDVVTFDVVGADYYGSGVHHDSARQGVYLPCSWSWAPNRPGPVPPADSIPSVGRP